MREIWTIGHWTCPETTFIGPPGEQQIEVLVDGRARPGSRSSPQFGRDTMRDWLQRARIEYIHLDDLGGRRRKQPLQPDINSGWQTRSSRIMRITRCRRATSVVRRRTGISLSGHPSAVFALPVAETMSERPGGPRRTSY